MAYLLLHIAYLCLAALVGAQKHVFPNSYQEPPPDICITAEGVQGECVLLQHCQELFDLFRSSRTKATRKRLNNLRCSSRSEIYPRVCCTPGHDPHRDPIPPTRPTPRPPHVRPPVHPVPPVQPVQPAPIPPTRPTPRPPHVRPPVQPVLPVQPVQPAPIPPTRPTPRPPHVRPPVHPVPPIGTATPGPSNTTSGGENLLNHPNIHLLPLEDCGLKFATKIYNGNETDLDEFPWAALLEYELNGARSFQCGGSLINNRYVLTAGHCSSRGTIGQYRLVGVRLGEYNTVTNPDCETDLFGGPPRCADPVKDFGIEEEVVHPEYKSSTSNQYHDIALLRLDNNVEFSDFIRPICIPTVEKTIVNRHLGKTLTATGWGRTQSESKSAIKMKADMPIVPNDDCKKVYEKSGRRVASTQICAGGVEGVDVCNGDSGGPLMSANQVNNQVQYHVTGIVSYGAGACHYGQPGVYTQVGSYSSWILDQLKP